MNTNINNINTNTMVQINQKIEKQDKMDEYIDIISNKCAYKIPSFKVKEKINDDDVKNREF